MAEKLLPEENKVVRHSLSVRLVHWLVALSTFALLFSGFGQLPLYKRYMVDQIPGLGWTSNFSITLYIHYVAAMVLIFAVVYHVVYHTLKREFGILPRRGDFRESIQIIKCMLGFGEEPPSDKYLAEQRLAYAYFAVSFLLIIVTGIIKVIKNLPSSSLMVADSFMKLNTALHNVATFMILFGIITHLAAFLYRDNRKLIPGMFSGKVDLDYARRRHSIWCNRLLKNSSNKTFSS
ncbi:formate dehydrogenase subunit gamma [Calderihabitans maritimus]|uniref:Cytochrome b561 bacterial/Ni-hydrogenase domain-containing protein n=1 Tax=Calderihabitans maritimus TaxID=1246530 RepID=A0A1Z5HQ52_9FIRM|nr:cytochrome b/b6 domain-containing protein [Calderihabitans maritimus]GAW91497.1 hypothetical protein TherJR_1635 [Calderihabitans maritimus]